MGRSKIMQLPPELREWLDAELVRRGFGDLRRLAAELKREAAARGSSVSPSKSSVHRYSQELERRLDAIRASTEAARAIAAAAPDDADQRSAAIISLVQTDIFDTIVKLREADTEKDHAKRMKMMSAVASNIAKLSRASVNQKKHELEVRAKAAATADKVAKLAKKGGMSAGTIDTIRREILGIGA